MVLPILVSKIVSELVHLQGHEIVIIGSGGEDLIPM